MAAGLKEHTNTVGATASGSARALSARDAVVALCFFASGFVGLAYEIAWIRKASLVFGAASLALSTVLAVFFLGWAIGSYAFGRYSRRTTRPLRVYGLLEIGLGLVAMLSPIAFVLADKAYGLIYPQISHSVPLLSLGRFILVVILLLPPSILMGGTLPLLCRQYVVRKDKIAFTVGLLYGLNTFGAAVGCAVCGFVLIPTLGVDLTIYLGAALNITVGLIAWRIPLSAPIAPEAEEETTAGQAAVDAAVTTSPAGRHTANAVVGVLFFLAGFVILANEVLWTRYLSLLTRNTVHTYTLTLSVILVGIVLGSVLTAGFFDKTGRRAFYFGAVQILGGLIVLTVLMLPAAWWQGKFDTAGIATRLWIIASVLLLPAILSGISFPLAIRMVVENPLLAGGGVGRMTAINTLGGIIGSVAAGFLGLPLLGLHTSVLITSGVSLLIGITAWMVLARSLPMYKKGVLAVAAIAIWLGIPRVMGTRLPADFLGSRTELVDFSEGISSHLAVLHRDNELVLEIDRLWQGSSRKTHQIMAAHIPMMLHPNPKRVVVIGVGCGQTCSRFLMYDIDALDSVDIEDKLFAMVRKHYDSAWMDDERVRLIVEDGRNLLTHGSGQYDLISIEVGQTFRPGIASFYSADFYERAKERLAPGGYVSQFVPLAFLTADEFRSVIATFIQVYPQSILWFNTKELLLIGCHSDDIKLSLERFNAIGAEKVQHDDMAYAYWGGAAHWLNRPEVFLGGFLCGPAGLANIAGNAPILHDDLPSLEYSVADHQELSGMDSLDLLRANLEPLEVVFDKTPDAEVVSASSAIRELNLNDIAAGAYLVGADRMKRAGKDQREVEWTLREANRLNPENVAVSHQFGKILADLGRNREAALQFADALRINPEYAQAHNDLGALLANSGEFETARFHLSEAVRIDPKMVKARINLGGVLAEQGQVAEAFAQYLEALRIQPNDADVYFHLGNLHVRQGQVAEAAEAYRAALRHRKGFAEAQSRLDLLLASQGTSGDGAAGSVASTAPNDREAERLYSAALITISQGDRAKAIEQLEAALAIDAAHGPAHMRLGTLLAQNGQVEPALTHLTEAVRIDPNSAEAHYNLAIMFAQLGRAEEAMEHCRQTLRARPEFAPAHNTLGMLLVRKGKVEEAIEHYREALRIKPDFADAQRNMQEAAKLRGPQ